MRFVTNTGPEAWAPYLINGDASGLTTAEVAAANRWMDREDVSHVVGIAAGEDGDEQTPRFTWSMRLHCPEADCEGGSVLDYMAHPRSDG
ncbi:hypothetical protein GURKE_04750 [Brevundimonas phage vB_BpoS-Gurke]|uniref:DUF6926 domain-containing protein n=1 Tax=Brevundimonas phage vB_BpoS-Gurke TaxID=2948599 RepID=A0A9E7STM0_9CAUD|nr:hypothetical protein GURKE_04750 [Brevundimonas phage vB_BpoS-Gurke]